MSEEKQEWFIAERAKTLARLHLSRRKDLLITQPGKDVGLEFIVYVSKEGEPAIRQFGVFLRGTKSATTEAALDKLLRPTIQRLARIGPFPYPTCLLHFTMDDDQGYFTWVTEPEVTEDGPRLVMHEAPHVQKLDRAALDEIVDRVDRWYDVRMAVCMLSSSAKEGLRVASAGEIESLQIFVESANELEASNFIAQAKDGISTSIRQLGDRTLLLERRGPEHEAVKALLLTVRFFYQNNETSIKKTADLVKGLAVPNALQDEFAVICKQLNKFLDAASPIKFQTSIGADTNREIFEIFLYGCFAHANREKRRRVKSWEQGPCFDDLRARFDVILVAFVSAVAKLKAVCVKILTELGVAA